MERWVVDEWVSFSRGGEKVMKGGRENEGFVACGVREGGSRMYVELWAISYPS